MACGNDKTHCVSRQQGFLGRVSHILTAQEKISSSGVPEFCCITYHSTIPPNLVLQVNFVGEAEAIKAKLEGSGRKLRAEWWQVRITWFSI